MYGAQLLVLSPVHTLVVGGHWEADGLYGFIDCCLQTLCQGGASICCNPALTLWAEFPMPNVLMLGTQLLICACALGTRSPASKVHVDYQKQCIQVRE